MNKRSRIVWCYKHADFTKARQLILDIDWDSLLINDIDIAWANWYKAFMEVMKKCIPRRQLPINQRNIPWINKKVTQAMKRRNRLYKNSRKSTTARSKYQLARNRVVSHIRKAKEEYFAKLRTKDQKQFWKTVKLLSVQKSMIPTLTQNSTVLSNDLEKARTLNSFSSECFNTSVPPIKSIYHSPSGTCPDLFCYVEEIEHLLLSLDINKSSGPDGISGKMLKATAHEIAPSVTKLLNISIMCKGPPTAWKHSNVVPIPKKNNASSVTNFIVTYSSKVLEKHIHMLILEHIMSYSSLSSMQWGFQQGKSTELALLSTINDWLSVLEKGQDIAAVFFDFKKAFDRVPHSALINKLQYIGLSQDLVSWIHNYLAD